MSRGRPKNNTKRDKGIRIRLTEEELEKLHTIAAKENCSVSEYIRKKILEKENNI